MKRTIIILISCVGLQFSQHTDAAPLGTAFNYNGRLNDGGGPANGRYDFRFILYNALFGGSQVGPIVTNANVVVSNGLFSTTVDLGPGIFDGTAYWMELGVRTNASPDDFTTLSPRQPILSTPNSLYAFNAGSAAGVAANSITTASLQNNSVTPEKLASGGLVSSLNGLQNAVTLAAGAGVSITPSGNTLTLASTGSDTDDWKLTGNIGTLPGTHFLGTRDNQPLTFKVNNTPALLLRFEGNSPNIIAGGANNSIGTLTRGSVILGGGDPGDPNAIEDNVTFGTITGGQGNRIRNGAGSASIAGGFENVISAPQAVIGGGSYNSVSVGATTSVIGGGYNNAVRDGASSSTIAGGSYNIISTNASSSFIGGGERNTVFSGSRMTVGGGLNNVSSNGSLTVIGGGEANRIVSSHRATIGGGQNNLVDFSNNSFIGGGEGNTALNDARWSMIGGGQNNTVSNSSQTVIAGGIANRILTSQFSMIGGGEDNTIEYFSRYAAISGGLLNNLSNAMWSTIGGGETNRIVNSYHSTIGGGQQNVLVNANWSAIGGGRQNTVDGNGGAIAGGQSNHAGSRAVVGGGQHNEASVNATVAGGADNIASGGSSAIGGGELNVASAIFATVPGGLENEAGGSFSLAAGHRAKADHGGSFVWADYSSVTTDFHSARSNEFGIRAEGGVRIESERGIALNAADRPIITRGFDPFDTNAPDYKQGHGRWGLFMEFNHLVLGMPTRADREIAFARYNTDGTYVSLAHIDQSGNFYTAGAINPPSDRNVKTNFATINARQILERVCRLPIQTWSYTNSTAVRHIGPMAQDFHAAFEVGTDERHITTVDADGVALAAIQGLHQIVEQQAKELREKEARLAEMEKRVGLIEKALQLQSLTSPRAEISPASLDR